MVTQVIARSFAQIRCGISRSAYLNGVFLKEFFKKIMEYLEFLKKNHGILWICPDLPLKWVNFP